MIPTDEPIEYATVVPVNRSPRPTSTVTGTACGVWVSPDAVHVVDLEHPPGMTWRCTRKGCRERFPEAAT